MWFSNLHMRFSSDTNCWNNVCQAGLSLRWTFIHVRGAGGVHHCDMHNKLRCRAFLTSDWCNNARSAEVTARGQRAEFRSSLSPRTKPDGSDFWTSALKQTQCSQIQYAAALMRNFWVSSNMHWTYYKIAASVLVGDVHHTSSPSCITTTVIILKIGC